MSKEKTEKKVKEKKDLFDIYGEFDSAEEINRAAEGFKKEGDIESLLSMAEENGIDKEDAKDYADGFSDTLTTVYGAAIAKLDVEMQAGGMPIKVIGDMAKTLCQDLLLAAAIRKKGKRIKEIYELMRSEASKHRSGSMGCSCGTDRQLIRIIQEYYLEGEAEARKEIQSLYE